MSDAPSLALALAVSDNDTVPYWCYNCNKRVSVETLANLPDVVCYECKNGFVESIQSIPDASSDPPHLSPDLADDSTFGSHFLQMLRLLAQAAREDGALPQPPLPPSRDSQYEGDFLRLELNGWINADGEEDEDGEEEKEDEDGEEEKEDEDGEEEKEDEDGDDDQDADENEGNEENQEEDDDGGRSHEDQQRVEENRSVSGNENEANRDYDHEDEDEEDLRRRRGEMLRLRIRDFATRSRTGRNRILDWAEILMGIEDNSIVFHIEGTESDRYIGNPGDYVDAAGYEALLQNLAENDGGRRGAPPAAKSAVETLETFEIASEAESILCVVCKDVVGVGEMAKKLPCGHGYHGECIVKWLGTRNSCPVCRFELPTDDAEYEDERKKRMNVSVNGGSSSGWG